MLLFTLLLRPSRWSQKDFEGKEAVLPRLCWVPSDMQELSPGPLCNSIPARTAPTETTKGQKNDRASDAMPNLTRPERHKSRLT